MMRMITTSFFLALVALITIVEGSAYEDYGKVKLEYHNGPLLVSKQALKVHVIWYGKFSHSQRSILTDFLSSFYPSKAATILATSDASSSESSSVSTWWNTLKGYTLPTPKSQSQLAAAKPGNTKDGVALASVRMGMERRDELYSRGKFLKRRDIAAMVENHANKYSSSSGDDVYLVFTSEDVGVEGFCRNTCGFHAHKALKNDKENKMLYYGWVGNSAKQCPGRCAWPFAKEMFYGPQTMKPLKTPNGDVGVDGMVMNLASVMAGMVTNPERSGYYQGHRQAPLEAASACAGIFGKGAYPGYPGVLKTDRLSGASYNAEGVNGRKFLLPAVWNPETSTCTPLP